MKFIAFAKGGDKYIYKLQVYYETNNETNQLARYTKCLTASHPCKLHFNPLKGASTNYSNG